MPDMIELEGLDVGRSTGLWEAVLIDAPGLARILSRLREDVAMMYGSKTMHYTTPQCGSKPSAVGMDGDFDCGSDTKLRVILSSIRRKGPPHICSLGEFQSKAFAIYGNTAYPLGIWNGSETHRDS
jgi:hypothetical protein